MAHKVLHNLAEPTSSTISLNVKPQWNADGSLRLLVQFQISIESMCCSFCLNQPSSSFPDSHSKVISSEAFLAFPGRVSCTLLYVPTASGPFLYHGAFHTVIVWISITTLYSLYCVFGNIKFYIFKTVWMLFFMAKLRINLILILPMPHWIIKIQLLKCDFKHLRHFNI